MRTTQDSPRRTSGRMAAAASRERTSPPRELGAGGPRHLSAEPYGHSHEFDLVTTPHGVRFLMCSHCAFTVLA